MEILLLLPASLVFLYSLYRLVKDDYIFIRKGISLEQSFDIAFTCFWISLFFSRLVYLLFDLANHKNIFLDFFRLRNGGFSLTGLVIGGMIALYIISKYKKLPLGRLGDFLSLSFLFALPVGFICNVVLVRKAALLHILLSSVLYFMLVIFFVQFLYPKLMSRTIREGTLALLFVVFYSVITIVTSVISSLKDIHAVINTQNITLIILLITSIILFMKVERPFSQNKRSLHR